jgi:hypothetical protein
VVGAERRRPKLLDAGEHLTHWLMNVVIESAVS